MLGLLYFRCLTIFHSHCLQTHYITNNGPYHIVGYHSDSSLHSPVLCKQQVWAVNLPGRCEFDLWAFRWAVMRLTIMSWPFVFAIARARSRDEHITASATPWTRQSPCQICVLPISTTCSKTTAGFMNVVLDQGCTLLVVESYIAATY